MPRYFDTWNTCENFLSQNPKASQERFLLVYLVFACNWRQICSTQLSKPSPKLRSWAPLLVFDATVRLIGKILIYLGVRAQYGKLNTINDVFGLIQFHFAFLALWNWILLRDNKFNERNDQTLAYFGLFTPVDPVFAIYLSH